MHFTYILYSVTADRYYVGASSDPEVRVAYHNRGDARSTRAYSDWELVFVQPFPTKTEALRFERQLKRAKSIKTLQRCIADPRNQIDALEGTVGA